MPAPAAAIPSTYEIRLGGHLDARWAERLGVTSLTHAADGTTVLGGIAADQALLHGLLQRIRDLGLTLISVVRVGAEHSPFQPDPLPEGDLP